MTTRLGHRLACFASLLLALPVCARPGESSWTDLRGDAVVRRTDPTNSAPLNPASTLPDLVSATVVAWDTPTPLTNPYSGTPIDPQGAHLFRLDVVFLGLVNPPGPLSGQFDPYRFGNSPLYGFLEINVDNDIDTGGQYGPGASSRYLANIGRFGRLPFGPLSARAALRGTDVNASWIARSGEDFSLVLCGCEAPEVVSEGGNQNHIFDAGETWIVHGRFFQRSTGYRECSFAFNGSAPGLYDPPVNLRFSHDIQANLTTISLVYALDNTGSALLRGESQQELPDHDVDNQNSIDEALRDVISAAQFPLSGPAQILAGGWRNKTVTPDMLDPTRWQLNALFGTCSSSDQPAPSFIWTDTGFRDVSGDLSGDGIADAADLAIVRNQIRSMDGTRDDGEGTSMENGAVLIRNFGTNFNAADLNGDGWIDDRDARYYCVGDYNSDGYLNVGDFLAFLSGYVGTQPRADIDHNGVYDVRDFLGFSYAYANGCQ